MPDIDAIRTYWERELALEKDRHESVPIIRSPAEVERWTYRPVSVTEMRAER
ncbi:MAG: hypothetical protein OXG04_26940 [Acidobacteria bacterium]|nr:hypothetical protein [Acidobacteriota bacterium]